MSKQGVRRQMIYQSKRHAQGLCWQSGCHEKGVRGGRCAVHAEEANTYLKDWAKRKRAWLKQFADYTKPEVKL